MDSGTEIWRNAMEIGGDVAKCFATEEDDGPFAIIEECGNNKVIAVVKDFREARIIASFAVRPDCGGYGSVRVEVTDLAPTHEDFGDWL